MPVPGPAMVKYITLKHGPKFAFGRYKKNAVSHIKTIVWLVEVSTLVGEILRVHFRPCFENANFVWPSAASTFLQGFKLFAIQISLAVGEGAGTFHTGACLSPLSEWNLNKVAKWAPLVVLWPGDGHWAGKAMLHTPFWNALESNNKSFSVTLERWIKQSLLIVFSNSRARYNMFLLNENISKELARHHCVQTGRLIE